MFRIDRPVRETDRLVVEAMQAAGIPDRKIGRDERGRLEGVNESISATATVVVDVEELPEREACYVAVVVGTTPGHGSQVYSDG
jgi:hypothetical protein